MKRPDRRFCHRYTVPAQLPWQQYKLCWCHQSAHRYRGLVARASAAAVDAAPVVVAVQADTCKPEVELEVGVSAGLISLC